MDALVSFLVTEDYGSLTAADEVIDYGLITDQADAVDYGSITVSAFYSPLESTTEQGSVSATGGTGATISLSGIESESQAAIIGANGSVRFEVSGIQSISEQGNISLDYDYSLSLSGIGLNSSSGSVTASGQSQNIPSAAGGETFVRPLSVRDAKVKLKTLKGLFSAGYVSAQGQTVINNIIRLKSVSGNIDTNVVKASGILDISEDEIIILLAA